MWPPKIFPSWFNPRKKSHPDHLLNRIPSLRPASSSAAIADSFTPDEPPQGRVADLSSFLLPSLHFFLQSCAREGIPGLGEACHARMIRLGLHSDTLLSNMVINAYSKCGASGFARRVFDEMPYRSLVSWNTVIGCHSRNGEHRESLWVFLRMRKAGVLVNEFTVSSVVCACSANCAGLECRQLHGFVVKNGMDSNVFVGTAVLDVYGKCGLVRDAWLVFEGMEERSVVTWSSMMAGYVQNEMYEEAVALFRGAQRAGLVHDQFVISSAFCACAGMASYVEGRQVHTVSWKSGFVSNSFVCSSLVDMYAKCGAITDAYRVFSTVEEKGLVLMNAMITGFAKHARYVEVMILFEKMQQMGLCPNEITYVSTLSACSHAGLAENGRKYFDMMVKDHNLSPNVLHYSCMVDILGRVGLVKEAYDLIGKMPFHATPSIWGSLLSSCRVHKDLDLAQVAAERLFEVEPENAGNHVLLSDVYAAKQMWDKVATSRSSLKESEARKEKGMSWIEVGVEVHSFMVSERIHPKIDDICGKLDDLVEEMKKLGYRAKTEHDYHDVEEIEKQELLKHHNPLVHESNAL
ncbi:hypothetical protein MLD38_003775 [Melastoma candidum]|uniref:Uncharacterized protein n=1 Tax=Melastoma candidum TaxID=119954 RepID=A0ACB9S5L2_9MYRT|nr:hypothetical protein MLD38_003775 [Melastoma candidum]